MTNPDVSIEEFRRQALLLKQRPSTPSDRSAQGTNAANASAETEPFIVGRGLPSPGSRDEQLARHAAYAEKLSGM